MIRCYSSVLPRGWTTHGWITGYYHVLMGWVAPLACEILKHQIPKDEEMVIGGIPADEATKWGGMLREIHPSLTFRPETRVDDLPLLGFDFLTSFSSSQFQVPEEILDALQTLLDLDPPQAVPGRRLFISRRGAQRARSDEQEIETMLLANGFETVDFRGMTLRQQAQVVGSAEVLVGQHGAGLSNVLFAPPGSLVIEYERPRQSFLLHFENIAKIAGASYTRVLVADGCGTARKIEMALPEPAATGGAAWEASPLRTQSHDDSTAADYVITREYLEKRSLVPGITALIRYYNDRHTLLPCLESIRGVFDEIVIVHQTCDDYSEDLLARIREKHFPSLAGESIHTYEYPWFVYPPHYPAEWPEPEEVNTLANYCNYGLSKIRTEHFLKIDADQIYFRNILKEMVDAGRSEKVDYAGSGINIFIDKEGECLIDPKHPGNGGGGDHRMMPPTSKPWFIHKPAYEVLTGVDLVEVRFPKPVWLHLTQIRRPERQESGVLPLEDLSDHPAVAAALDCDEFAMRLDAARSAVVGSCENSLTLQWVDEVLVVGNGLIDRTLKLGEEIDRHPFVVRFGEGGIPWRLEPEKEFVGTKTDLYCLNGWLFHPAEHLDGCRVMFTRPLEDRSNLGRGLFVAKAKRDHIARVTSNLCHIPKRVFYDFFRDYGYDNPSSGLIFVYYVRRVLGKPVKLVNFGFAPGLPSFLDGEKPGVFHDTSREREILASIMADSALAVEEVAGVAHLRLAANAGSKLAHRLDVPDGSLAEIVAGEIWEQLDPGTAARVALDCWRGLKPGGSITVSTPDLGAVVRLLDEQDEEMRAVIQNYLDRHLPEAPINAPALVVNHWLRKCAFVYDEGLLVETLAEAGFVDFVRLREGIGMLTVTAMRPDAD